MSIKITILIADDHQLIRDTWTLVLNNDPRFKVLGTAASGDEAVELTRKLMPDIVLMDINIGKMSGFEATEKILKEVPKTRIIGLTVFSTPGYARRLIRMGARGYITKNTAITELFEGLVQVYHGKKYICKEVKEALAGKIAETESGPDLNRLSKREMEIVRFIKTGLSSREISMSLGLSMKTIEVHRYNILKKLKLKNSVTLVDFVNSQGY